MDARTKILSTLREAKKSKEIASLIEPNWTDNVFVASTLDLKSQFKIALENIGSTVFFCENKNDETDVLRSLLNARGGNDALFVEQGVVKSEFQYVTQFAKCADLANAKVSVTSCECLVANTGSVIVSSKMANGRRSFLFAPTHIVVATITDLVPDLQTAISLLKYQYGNQFPSQITTITGASRTADIEKTLVIGAHGPKELIVIIRLN